jgi:Zn-dependent protease
MDGTLFTALALIPALVFAIVFHEVAHGWTALALGDPTAKERKRLSLNPIRHIDAFGTIILPGLLYLSGLPAFGWAKPVPVIKQRLRNPRFGMMAVAAAGPATNIVLAVIGAVALGLLARWSVEPTGIAAFAITSIYLFILVNIFLALFNLLPIPPFDGSHIVEGVLPERAARVYGKFRHVGFALLIVVLVVIPYLFPQWDIVERVVLPPVAWAERTIMALADLVAGRFIRID